MKFAALRRPAVWGWLVLMAVAALIASRTVYVADLSAFLPSAPTGEQRVLVEQIQSGVTSRVVLIGLRGADAATRAQASRRLAATLRGNGQFEAVHNGDHGAWQETGQFLFERRYLLSPAVDAQRFSVEGLRAGIDETVSLLGTPAGSLIKPLLWRDPTGEVVRMGETLQPAASPRMEDGVWVSRDQPRAVLVATTQAAGSDLDGQARALDSVRQAFAALKTTDLALELSGPGAMGVDSRSRIQSEVQRLATADTIAMVVLLLLAFGSLKSLGIALLPVASGVLAGIVVVSLGFGQVHGITLGFGTTLIGEAVDYAIYYLIQARPTADTPPGQGHRQWRMQRWPTVRLGLWTSLAGFAALVFSGFAGLAQLGVFSVAGLVAAACTTRYVLPGLAPDGAPGRGFRRPLGRMMGVLLTQLPRLRWPLGLLTLAALAGLLGRPHAWHGTLLDLSPVPAQAQALDASLRADLGALEAGMLVAIEAPDEATALERAEEAGRRLDALVGQGLLLGYESPARLLPSPATQATRRAALPAAEVLRARLAEAAAGGPLPALKLEPFIADVQAQRTLPAITSASFAGLPLASALQAQLIPGREGRPWTALLNLQLPPKARLDAPALRSLLDGLPGTRVVQIQRELDDLYAGYLSDALWQAMLGAGAVVVLLWSHLRSPRRLAWVVLPLAASVVLVQAGLGLSGAALGVLHLVGLLLVVAVGSNYALFFDDLRHEAVGSVDEDTLVSLLMANLTTVAAFGLLATSEVPALQAIGLTVAPGALLGLVLSAVFLGPRPPSGLVGESAP